MNGGTAGEPGGTAGTAGMTRTAGPPGPGYPQHWEADVLLADGGTAHLRPITPEDADPLRRLFGRLSQRTLYLRYHGSHPRLTPEHVRHLTEVDHRRRLCLVALVGGELVGVANAERYPDSDVAEVAFLIRDDQQGRGVGSVLLEHLAAAAAERGVRRFEAWVLADNRRMLRVFTDAGYATRSTVSSGEVQLHLAVDATTRSVQVGRAREHAAEARSIRRLLGAERVAVVVDGSREADEQAGRIIRRQLASAGETAPHLLTVHPTREQLAGLPALPRLRQAGRADLVVACVGSRWLPALISDAAHLGAHALLVATDTDPSHHAALRDQARAHGMRLVGPASAGVVNRHAGLALWDGPELPGPGPVGVFTQSAPAGRALLFHARRRGIGVSSVIDAGDRADLSGNDLLQYWQDDPETSAALMVLETFGNPRKFLRLVAAVGAVKPVVVVRPGGDDLPGDPVDELLRRAGVIRVSGLIQGLDAIRVLTGPGAPAGDRVAVLAGSRAAARLGAQALTASGLTAEPAAEPGVPIGAPSGAPAAPPDARLVVREPEVPPPPVPDAPVPTVTLRLGGDLPARPGEVAFRWPESAAAALAAAVGWRRWQATRTAPENREDPARAAAARAWLAGQRHAAPRPPDPVPLLDLYRIPVQPWLAAADAAEAARHAERLGPPVVVKSLAPAARHRPELGAVALGLTGPAEVAAAHRRLIADFGPPVVVQRQSPPGVPVLLRIDDDPRVGPVLSCTVGSVNAALGVDAVHRSAPLSLADARELVTASRSAALLRGWRGAPGGDVEALAALAQRLGDLAEELPGLAWLELAPVLAHPAGVTVLGAAAGLSAGDGRRPDSGPRRMV